MLIVNLCFQLSSDIRELIVAVYVCCTGYSLLNVYYKVCMLSQKSDVSTIHLPNYNMFYQAGQDPRKYISIKLLQAGNS